MTDKLKYYTEDSFIKSSDDVFHGFFTKVGGVSSAPYLGLHCGIGSDDDPSNVQQNRFLVANEMGIAPQDLFSLYQVHSNSVLCVGQPWTQRPKADGFVTDRPGVGLGILTADCTPVLFYGRKADSTPVVGAAHAGWKGALSGVLENTVSEMERLGALKNQIRACVGPCISKASYEVSIKFVDAFIEENEECERFFQSGAKEGHVMFDMSGYCAWRLFRAGLKNISMLDVDTYKNEEEFFSFRRATHRAEKDYGRQISVISIRE